MSAENLRTGNVRHDETRDPRSRLVREKYFSLRPRPLERWLWTQGVPASAERVFWLHWHEGMKTGTWCSEIPIRRVAAECCLDVSSVTRAYQLLARLGCLRRTDPGRNPENPFHQATAVTEVKIPRELLIELDRHPNRQRRHPETIAAATSGAAPPAQESPAPPAAAASTAAADPFAGLSFRDRHAALTKLTRAMSASERQSYDEALRTHRSHMTFDDDSGLGPEERGRVLQHLATLASAPRTASAVPDSSAARGPSAPHRLSVFELARLRRDIQANASLAEATELVRQVAWSIEQGSLRRFPPVHAINIALKKIREGAWTRPNRMPPNWLPGVRGAEKPETCSRA